MIILPPRSTPPGSTLKFVLLDFATQGILKAKASEMPPRTKRKLEPQQDLDERSSDAVEIQSENPFEELAKKHWLKSTKKQTKVKVKPDVLKSEIWDVLESENFEFKSLLVLENLQILEKYGTPKFCVSSILTLSVGTYGRDTTRIRRISMLSLLLYLQMSKLGSICQHGVSDLGESFRISTDNDR